MRRHAQRWMPVIVLLLGLAPARIAWGQAVTTTGGISGRVLDESGLVMPGTTVTITSPAMIGSRTVVTDGEGLYRFTLLAPGVYRVSFTLQGFTTRAYEQFLDNPELRSSLVTSSKVALVASVVWHQFGDAGPWAHALETAGTLAQNMLPPAEAPKPAQQAALERFAANLAEDFDVAPLRKEVNNRHADTVETAGRLVAVLVELATEFEDRHYAFERADVAADFFGELGMALDRDPAPVIFDGDAAIDVDRDADRGGVARHRLVDRVVDDFVNEVVKTSLGGVADVHRRSLANRL